MILIITIKVELTCRDSYDDLNEAEKRKLSRMNHMLRERPRIVSPHTLKKRGRKSRTLAPTPSEDLAEFCDIALIFPLFA